MRLTTSAEEFGAFYAKTLLSIMILLALVNTLPAHGMQYCRRSVVFSFNITFSISIKFIANKFCGPS